MTMNELVSVIIPVYNSEEYIDETIESVIQQNYSPIEIIIVDDGSTDSSGDKCDEWAKTDNRIKVFHTGNQGPSRARNYAIGQAKGKYILPVDSDDLIDSSYIEKAVSAISSDPNLGIVYCRVFLFGSRQGEWLLPDYSIEKILTSNCIFATALFRREDWERTGGYSDEMKYGFEDYDFWLSIISLGRRVYRIPEILFFYRIHPGSRSSLFQADCMTVIETNRKKYKRHYQLYRKFYRVFPPSVKIALYGAGREGETYYEFSKMTGVNNIVVWVDEDFDKINLSFIVSPQCLKDCEYDAVVIASHDTDTLQMIENNLVQNGIDRSIIYGYFQKGV